MPEINDEWKESLHLENRVDRLGIMVENYHKEKGKCEQTCKNFGERIGSAETREAVLDERVGTVQKAVDEIRSAVSGLQLKVAGIVGGIMVVFEIFDKVIKK